MDRAPEQAIMPDTPRLNEVQTAAVAAVFDDATLLVIEDAVTAYAALLDGFGTRHPELRADALRLHTISGVFSNATGIARARAYYDSHDTSREMKQSLGHWEG